jgi:GTP pyrophosphokinase
LGDLKLARILDYFEPAKKIIEPPPKETPAQKVVTDDVVFGSLGEGIKYDYAACCHPLFPDPIVGLITRARGVTIHRRDCVNLKATHKVDERLMFAKWSKNIIDQHTHSVLLKITAVDDRTVTNNITSVFLSFDLTVNQLKSETSAENQMITITTLFEIGSLAELHRLIDKIYQLNSIVYVERLLTTE